MNTPLRVLIAEGERDMREFLQESLCRLGHEVVGTCLTGRELVVKAKESVPDLVIAVIRMAELDGIDAASAINCERPVPVILISAHNDVETLGRAGAIHIVGYLIKPISELALKAMITLAMSRFENLRNLAKETAELRQALEDRKLVEKAKGILMKRLRVEEDEAFRRLRKSANNQNVKLTEICRRIMSAEDVFQRLELE